MIFCFEKIVKSNFVISSLNQSSKNNLGFHNHVIKTCQCFLGLINIASNLKKGKSKSKSKNKGKNKGKINKNQGKNSTINTKKVYKRFIDSENILSAAAF